MRLARAMLPALLVSLAVAAAACWGEEETSTPEPTVGPQMTLEDIYSRLAEAISRPGFVFHASVNYDLGESESWTTALALSPKRPKPWSGGGDVTSVDSS